MPQVALAIPLDHPAFAGHFPGRPIVPGVVLLDAAQRIVETQGVALTGIAVAKFHSPAGPGDELALIYDIDGASARFEIRCGARKIADGRFTVSSEPLA